MLYFYLHLGQKCFLISFRFFSDIPYKNMVLSFQIFRYFLEIFLFLKSDLVSLVRDHNILYDFNSFKLTDLSKTRICFS